MFVPSPKFRYNLTPALPTSTLHSRQATSLHSRTFLKQLRITFYMLLARQRVNIRSHVPGSSKIRRPPSLRFAPILTYPNVRRVSRHPRAHRVVVRLVEVQIFSLAVHRIQIPTPSVSTKALQHAVEYKD